jgi:hypothetical protein
MTIRGVGGGGIGGIELVGLCERGATRLRDDGDWSGRTASSLNGMTQHYPYSEGRCLHDDKNVSLR